MSDKLLMEIKNFSVSFLSNGHYIPAIKNTSLQISSGEMLAIVGESGSGKSVTALSILQLLPSNPITQQEGEIFFYINDEKISLTKVDFKTMSTIRGNKIGMVFQEPMSSLNPVQPCGVQVMESLMIHKKLKPAQAREDTIQLFDELSLPDPKKLFDKYPHQLSGGQQQRVMIAMAICCKPALLICDEPTTALDTIVQKNILQLIRSIQQKYQMGVLFISHDLGVVADIADRVAVMYKGEIVEMGMTDSILKSPQHAYTKGLLLCRPALYERGDKLPVVEDFLFQNKEEINPSKNLKPQKIIETKKESAEFISVSSVNVIFKSKEPFFGKAPDVKQAVNDVSFKIYEGETLGLVGESGCGKTTLGRALLGLQPISGGRIFFRGKNLAQLTEKEMRQMRTQIQIVFQDPYSSLNPRITVGDAIAEPLKVHCKNLSSTEIKNKVFEMLDKTGLGPLFYTRYPHECSGGQRQRIVIARALALNPSFVVCDESVSALDMSVQAQILNLLNSLKEIFKFTALFISHDLSVVRYISDRIIVMEKGRIIETGSTTDIYENPQTAYTRKLIESVPGRAYFNEIQLR